jgi:hypothetical protein
MGKFNTKSSINKTTNFGGGEAFKETDKLEFVSILLTSFVQDQFYRGENETVERVIELITGLKDKKFAAKSAIYARQKFGMRSISHLVAAEIAKQVKGQEWTKNFYEMIIHRPDDITEILSCYLGKYGKPYPNSMKKGLAKAFNKFDEYQLGKYRGEGNDVSLVDAVNYVHPIPTGKNKDALKKLIAGELKSKNTWEKCLTQAGQKAKTDEEKAELKKEVWADLIKEKKIGYFALLRNLRNIIEQAPEVIDEAIEMLTDEALIKKSLVLPFRFTTAQNEIESMDGSKEARKIMGAIDKAIEISLQNVPKFDGDTLVVLDTSGSMSGRPAEIGSLFSAILAKSNNADFMMFSEDAKYKNLNLSDSVTSLAKGMSFQCGGTNFHAIFEKANKKYDRIIILSDMQGWMGYDSPVSTFNKYKAKFGATPKVYSFDLQGYGTLQFPQQDVYCLTGFSEKIFSVMSMLEKDRNALINEIEQIQL